jgi:ATP-dependent RNA helicase DDX35
MDAQMKVFQKTPNRSRKVVVSTNIAEASITIDNIVFVIDCGYCRIRIYDAESGLDSLLTVPISKASAIQRAGRAGRVRPGKTFRLYSEDTFQDLQDHSIPELQRCNLAPVILQLKALGIQNVLRFPYLSAPPAELMVRALESLYALGALDERAQLTRPVGYRMVEFPFEPESAKMLLASHIYKCSEEIATIVAMLSVQVRTISYIIGPYSLRTCL